ncbi:MULTISPECIES: hypothetical protein [unclassified Leifsonia]|uniref:hypothetical protein n=1 Tax=unclassified Leifsonia TaxID=2663824 RepID=UPI0007002BE3|nr:MULTISPECIES: hypothetical protein [unclassified Leifsonia]KQX07355.1 hypothetical protein ASC59_06160 [Leifsonia sp. Root1293]KRA11637.1 hypothetical protein ASD61_06160 [Leifsonia sp. Root60]
MARTPKPIVSSTGGTPVGGELPPRLLRTIDFGLGVQRPVVLAHIRSIRRRNPDATPAQLVRILERRYMAATTTGGAAVGATAVIPGIGTGMTIVLSGVETAGFLEATALYAQSVAEVHGIAVSDPDRARALIMTMMLGSEGSNLVRQLAGQVNGTGAGRNAYWGELVTANLPRALVGPLADRLKSMFLRRFAVGAGASVFTKAIPFGVGAVIGGVGNRIVSGRVVQSSRLAFGMAPESLPRELEPHDIVVTDSRGNIATRAIGGVHGGVSRASNAINGRMRAIRPRRKSATATDAALEPDPLDDLFGEPDSDPR